MVQFQRTDRKMSWVDYCFTDPSQAAANSLRFPVQVVSRRFLFSVLLMKWIGVTLWTLGCSRLSFQVYTLSFWFHLSLPHYSPAHVWAVSCVCDSQNSLDIKSHFQLLVRIRMSYHHLLLLILQFISYWSIVMSLVP